MKEIFVHIEDMPKDCAHCHFSEKFKNTFGCAATYTKIQDSASRNPDCPLKCIEDPLEKPTTIKSVPGMELYEAKVIFERNISACGLSYLTVYGKHINGYFCCIPNWKICCEMAEPCDTFYNFVKLTDAGIEVMTAEIIANEIKKTAEALSN